MYYPEDLFDDLLSGKLGQHYDLLELENTLAKSVLAVVILLESEGAIAELGAFANHETLSRKLTVVVSGKYRQHKLFIMLGPIRQLREKDSRHVIFHDFKDHDVEQLGGQVRSRLARPELRALVSEKPDNPIVAQEFLLAAIFAKQSLNLDDAARLVGLRCDDSDVNPTVVARIALSMLVNRRFVSVRGEEYAISARGTQYLKQRIASSVTPRKIWASIDAQRIQFLNYALRQSRIAVH